MAASRARAARLSMLHLGAQRAAHPALQRFGALVVEVETVSSLRELRLALATQRHALVLCDESACGRTASALRLTRRVRPELPFVVLARAANRRVIELFRSGATDVVLRHERARLAATLRRALAEKRGRGRRRADLLLAEAKQEAERALRRSETVLEQAGQMAHLGAWWIEVAPGQPVERGRLWWSDEVYRIFGHEPGQVEVTNDLFYARVHPEDRPRVRLAVAQAIAARTHYAIEHRIVRPEGGERVVLEHAQLEFDARGRLQRIVGAVQDVTERNRWEQALREADRNKTEFLAMLSHELRNPLAPIGNSVYVLGRAAPGSEQARRARAVIERQVRQLSRLVEDLLDVTRISRGKIRLQRESVDFAALVRRCAEDHRAEFDANTLVLSLALPERVVRVHGDASRLAQVVGNLLQNAVKFTLPGGRVALVLEAAGERALLKVADTGVGIAPEALRRLFEPFVQLEHSLERSRGGIGLGLALVRGLVELHGGRVEARSDGLGRGAEFTIELPLQLDAAEPAVPAGEAPPAVSRRVLVIEDDVDAAESLKEALQLDRHQVEVAYSGPAALDAARRFKPEVVVCDIGLPGMNGYEVARALRLDPELAAVTLVALSGYAPPEELLKQAGFDRYLSKPPDLAALERALGPPAGPRPSGTGR